MNLATHHARSARLPIAGLAGLLLLCSVFSSQATRALYGGSEVSAQDAGSLVLLRWRKGRWWGTCSGTLIAPDAVLTAAHCVRSATLGDLTIREVQVGHPRERPERIGRLRAEVHPQFDAQRPELGHDLAVLRLVRASTRAQPMPLAALNDNVMLAGPRVQILGFGVTRRGGRGRAQLQGATLESLSPFQCFSGNVQGMAQTRFCAASPDAGVCPGDSGAPAILDVNGTRHVVGVVSMAVDNQSRCVESAAVITRVTAFRDWIASVSR